MKSACWWEDHRDKKFQKWIIQSSSQSKTITTDVVYFHLYVMISWLIWLKTTNYFLENYWSSVLDMLVTNSLFNISWISKLINWLKTPDWRLIKLVQCLMISSLYHHCISFEYFQIKIRWLSNGSLWNNYNDTVCKNLIFLINCSWYIASHIFQSNSMALKVT